MNAMNPKQPEITGHRGAARFAPENTLAGIRRAAHAGVPWVEIDTQLTADDIPVVIHDATVDRCSNGHGAVRSLSLAAIRSLDAGSWFDPAFTGEPIPTLDEALALIDVLGLNLNLEIKVHHPEEVALQVSQVRACVERSGFPIERLFFSSFLPEAVRLCQQQMPAVRRGQLINEWVPRVLDAIGPMDLYSININHRHLTEAIAREIKAAGVKLMIYTLNDPEQVARFTDWGVDNIITDLPGALGASQRAV